MKCSFVTHKSKLVRIKGAKIVGQTIQGTEIKKEDSENTLGKAFDFVRSLWYKLGHKICLHYKNMSM